MAGKVKQPSKGGNYFAVNRARTRRRPSDQQPGMSTEESGPAKPKYLTTDTSVGHVFTMICMRACRRITIHISLRNRLAFYFGLIVIGGILCDFAPVVIRAFMPIRSTKDGILNQYFVKVGWGWTLAMLVPFVAMTGEVINASYPKDRSPEDLQESPTESTTLLLDSKKPLSAKQRVLNVLPDLMRIVINTLIWYISIGSFLSIETATSACDITGHKARAPCLKAGGRWYGYDISGHTFLLIFSTLSMISEASVMAGWEPLGHHLNAKQQHYRKTSLGDHRQQVTYQRYLPWIRINFLFITILCLIWDWMLLQTALYYHSMMQKALAGAWAVVAWFLAYRVLYQIEALSPVIRAPQKPSIEI